MTKNELLEFICDLYGIDQCTNVILKHINQLVTEHGLSYLDIARALSYYVDILHKNVDATYGIIRTVELVYKDARNYFNKLKKLQEEQKAAINKASTSKTILINYKKEKTIKRNHIDLNKI